jgi:hypothetical protein
VISPWRTYHLPSWTLLLHVGVLGAGVLVAAEDAGAHHREDDRPPDHRGLLGLAHEPLAPGGRPLEDEGAHSLPELAGAVGHRPDLLHYCTHWFSPEIAY